MTNLGQTQGNHWCFTLLDSNHIATIQNDSEDKMCIKLQTFDPIKFRGRLVECLSEFIKFSLGDNI